MELELLLDRCRGLELRAANVYRTFAAAARGEPELCTLWTLLAREEEEHARSIARARSLLGLKGKSRVSVDGWDEALREAENHLGAAERLGAAATAVQQVSAALDIEMTELEAARHSVLDAAHASHREEQADHAERLAKVAETLGDDPHLRLQVALLRARTRIRPV
jgi:rubrerythrin